MITNGADPTSSRVFVKPRCTAPTSTCVVHDSHDNVAAYGLFWYDPETATGLVEPMRTEDDHQRRGLARHILTTGIDLLAEAGAVRIKICYEPDNPASRASLPQRRLRTRQADRRLLTPDERRSFVDGARDSRPRLRTHSRW